MCLTHERVEDGLCYSTACGVQDILHALQNIISSRCEEAKSSGTERVDFLNGQTRFVSFSSYGADVSWFPTLLVHEKTCLARKVLDFPTHSLMDIQYHYSSMPIKLGRNPPCNYGQLLSKLLYCASLK